MTFALLCCAVFCWRLRNSTQLNQTRLNSALVGGCLLGAVVVVGAAAAAVPTNSTEQDSQLSSELNIEARSAPCWPARTQQVHQRATCRTGRGPAHTRWSTVAAAAPLGTRAPAGARATSGQSKASRRRRRRYSRRQARL